MDKYHVSSIKVHRLERGGDGAQWAQSLTDKYPRSVEYFLKFGSPFEKALTQAVVDLAGGKP